MSFRPTISIYLNKNIVDCGYYRNWPERYIMLECCQLARLLDGCTTHREVMERLGRTDGVEEWEQGERHQFYMSFTDIDEAERRHDSLVVERLRPLSVPASYCDDASIPSEIEENSEFPAIIDLTDRCIYWSSCGFIEHPEGDPISDVREYESALSSEDDGWLHEGRVSFDLIPYIECKLEPKA